MTDGIIPSLSAAIDSTKRTLPAITGGAGLGLLGLEALRRTQRVE